MNDYDKDQRNNKLFLSGNTVVEAFEKEDRAKGRAERIDRNARRIIDLVVDSYQTGLNIEDSNERVGYAEFESTRAYYAEFGDVDEVYLNGYAARVAGMEDYGIYCGLAFDPSRMRENGNKDWEDSIYSVFVNITEDDANDIYTIEFRKDTEGKFAPDCETDALKEVADELLKGILDDANHRA